MPLHDIVVLYINIYYRKCSLIITQPTNALIVCHLFLNHFFKTLSLLLHATTILIRKVHILTRDFS